MIEIIEIFYHASGIVGGILFILIAIALYKENKNVIRTNIFLRYNQFKTSFLVMSAGIVMFVIGNVLGWINHGKYEIFHDIGEGIYNISVLIFAFLIFRLIRRKND